MLTEDDLRLFATHYGFKPAWEHPSLTPREYTLGDGPSLSIWPGAIEEKEALVYWDREESPAYLPLPPTIQQLLHLCQLLEILPYD